MAGLDWSPRACASGFVSGGFEYQPRDDLRMGNHRQMTRLYLDGLGAHSLCHEPLEVGIDCAVLGRDRIEARFRPPGGLRGLAGEQSLLERLLDRIEHLCLFGGQIAREIPQECLLAKTSFITVKHDARGRS